MQPRPLEVLREAAAEVRRSEDPGGRLPGGRTADCQPCKHGLGARVEGQDLRDERHQVDDVSVVGPRVHDACMPAPYKLLVDEEATGSHIRAVEDSADVPPGSYVPVLGSADLVSLATRLSRRGYKVSHLDIRSRGSLDVATDELESAESRIIRRIGAGDDESALRDLQMVSDQAVIYEIELKTPKKDRVRLSRAGFVLAQGPTDMEPFITDLMSSWEEGADI